MKRFWYFSSFLSLSLTVSFCVLPVRAEAQSPKAPTDLTPPSDSAVVERANSLLEQMTTDEKIGQMSQIFIFGSGQIAEERIRAGQLGSVLFMTDPALINRLQHVAVDGSRLHIPLLFGIDVIHGFRTIFPVPIGMAASWDPSMVEKAQSVAAERHEPPGSIGPLVRCSTSPAIPGGAESSREQAKIPISVRQWL
jgi:beta-glucosidase